MPVKHQVLCSKVTSVVLEDFSLMNCIKCFTEKHPSFCCKIEAFFLSDGKGFVSER